MRKNINAKVQQVTCPWCGPSVRDYVVSVARNRGYCFICRRDTTIGEAIAETMGIEYESSIDSDDIVPVMIATGTDSTLSESAEIRGNARLMRCPVHGERTPSFILYFRQNLFHCMSTGAAGGANQYRWYVLSEYVRRGGQPSSPGASGDTPAG